MQSFIVLGLIPGTNIQFGFVVIALVFTVILFPFIKSSLQTHKIVKEMVRDMTGHRALPARAYHSRIQYL